MAQRALTPSNAAYCSECGAETKLDAVSCSRCNQPFEGTIQAVFCPICNSINPAEARECRNCKAKFPEPGSIGTAAPLAPGGGAGRGVPASDPATEPREGEGAGGRAALQRGPPGRNGARFVPRVRRPGRRDGGIAVEAGGALRPDARAAEAPSGADGLPHRPRARSDQGPRGLPESAGDPRTGRAQAADRGVAPGEGGHPAAGGRPRDHGENVSEYFAPPARRTEGARDVPAKPDRRLPTGTRAEGEGLRAAQRTGIGHRPPGGRVPPRDEPRP